MSAVSPSKSFTRRTVLAALGASAASLPGLLHAQAKWEPASPIRLVVPYAAGGGTDVLARLISAQVASALGQPLVIDNKPGVNGILGTNLVYAAPADGMTLLFAAADFISVAPHVFKKVVKFEPTRFTPVAPIAKMGFVLASRADNDAKDLAEVIERAKAKEVTYAHWGPGSTSQMAMELLKSKVPSMKLLPVPYGGAAPVMNAVMAGDVQYGFIPTPLAIASQSKLRLYAIASPTRFAGIKDVPTLAEKGYGVDADTWFGVLAPPQTPQNVIDALQAQVVKASQDPHVRTRMAEMGYTATSVAPRDFGGFIQSEYDRWGAVVRAANIRVED
ncbi:MAG: tripartite tricarboxylate transporter substrate binding protein [Acidovorax sp.]|nr:tripartite tricarboxylate transporter substrate binding protein [Acidovorax sp.]